MSPDDDRRWRDGVSAAIAALQAGERHSVEDRETLRREIRAAEATILKEVGRVDTECREFRHEVRRVWDEAKREQQARDEREDDRAAARDKEEKTGRRSITAAWIAGGFVALSSIMSTLVSLLDKAG